MPVALNCLSEEGRRALEEGSPEPVLHKATDIEFVYNKLNLGEGKLYIMEKKIIWVSTQNEEEKKKKITNFAEIANSANYLKHYEKNRDFYMHLLNDVNNVIVDSSNIALHAITSDKKICDNSCVYIQLNSDIIGGGEDDMDSMGNEDAAVAEEGTNHVDSGVDDTGDGTDQFRCGVDHAEGEEAPQPPREKLGKRLFTKMSKHRSVFKKNEQDHLGGKENSDEENADNEPIEEKITPEILLISKNYVTNDAIFRQLSNMDHSPDDEDDEGEEEAAEEEEEEDA
ncbi:hypothetical protein C922_01834 [Plasmodium inui San Antonio 1]|uniref:Voldacs domain-containing protein n=1 Tax=Plasmodium inui San Antonio 1 TaxID=1237626 RepID=W7AF46_9APIC|nr:hypothetical protein C922_01834 [Plasmodium inui San Antonio 1]EUD67649.1 hypothetical protein C922_01834 [Plasmodium inui San Antonio 1]